MIHGLALGTIGRDRVAGEELPETFSQNPAVGQFDSAIGADGFDRDQFPVGGPPTGSQGAIGLEVQPLAIRNRNFTRATDRDFVEQLVGDGDAFAIHLDQHANLYDAQ